MPKRVKIEFSPEGGRTGKGLRPIDDRTIRKAYEAIIRIRKFARPGQDATAIIREMRDHGKH